MHDRQVVAPVRSGTAPTEASGARERLIVALDFAGGSEALAFVERLDDTCSWFKVGLELFLAAGGLIVETLRNRGYSVFLDLKFHDIPNTVASAVRSVAPLGAQMLTVHASGGPAMLAAAGEAASSLANPPTLLAVTVLTSMDQSQLAATGIAKTPAEHALLLAKMACASGIHGLVCSPEEASGLRGALPGATLVTPGIRPAGAAVGDQKRIATPSAALSAGATYLVVGRPITRASNPAEAARAILDEMNQV
jgi:orotidine-5'-phosphate decarboxylase